MAGEQQNKRTATLAGAALSAWLCAHSAWAQSTFAEGTGSQPAEDWRFCPAPFIPDLYRPLHRQELAPDDPNTYINADEARAEQQNDFYLQGNVHIRRGPFYIAADEVHYEARRDLLQAEGGIRFETQNLLVVGDSAELTLGKRRGNIAGARLWLDDSHMRGASDLLELQGETQVTLQGASFTSCNEGRDHWMLKAGELRLDQAANEGVARHARLEIASIPILYSPYLSFPLRGRKTGLLAPDIGSSNVAGFELALPYYWNIAPNRDATFTPHYYEKRGLQAKTEFRYLNLTNSGRVYAEYLPNDKLFGDDRTGLILEHRGNPIPKLTTNLKYFYISDSDYLKDFGGELGVSSLTHLDRYLQVDYRATAWSAKALVQSFQTVDDTVPEIARPYRRLPQLRFDTHALPVYDDLEFQWSSELVNFDRGAGLIGRRMDLWPQLQWSQRKIWGFFVPRASVRYTAYQLENNDPDTRDDPVRTVPLFSTDSGLFFERDFAWGGQRKIQTLEPRLFYLYVPFRDQSTLLVDEAGRSRTFDSGATQLGFSQLFRENRFSGADRIGDANQLTVALTSRVLDARGREQMSASLGQILYFADREVTLPGGSVQTEPRSDLILEWRSRWTRYTSTAIDYFWNDQQSNTRKSAWRFRYQPDRDKMLRLEYRYEQNLLEQGDATVLWPLHRQWNFVARWQYSLRDELTLENFEGLEYQSCCWAVRVVHRSYLTETSQEDTPSHNDTVLLQFELKGLANVGSDINRVFSEGILE
jgi:LPS-assembly protein